MFEPLAIAFEEIGAGMKRSPTPTPVVEATPPPSKATFLRVGAEPGSPIQGRHNFVDLSIGESGLIAVCDDQRLYLSQDQGQSWIVGPNQDAGQASRLNALAVRPDGSQIFVGSVLGKFRMFDGKSAQPLGSEWGVNGVSPHTFRQAQFVPGQAKPVLWATLGNDLTSEGALVQGVIHREEAGPSAWEDLAPLRRRSDPQATPKCSFWGLAISKNRSTEQTAVVGGRRQYGVNAYQDVYRAKLTLGNYFEDWLDQDRVVGFGQPLVISFAGRYGEPMVMTHSENRVFIGAFSNLMKPLEHTGLEGQKILALKFAPDRHLWALTERQLLRSQEVF